MRLSTTFISQGGFFPPPNPNKYENCAVHKFLWQTQVGKEKREKLPRSYFILSNISVSQRAKIGFNDVKMSIPGNEY